MQLNVRARDNVSPATFAVDFNDISDTAGPYIVGLSAWVTTADPGAGVLLFSVDYEDPTAALRQLQFFSTPQLDLTDINSFFATETKALQRLSGSSIWQFNSQLIGSAGSALISYRILHSSAASTDLQPW